MLDPLETLGDLAAHCDVYSFDALTEQDRLDCECRSMAYRQEQMRILKEIDRNETSVGARSTATSPGSTTSPALPDKDYHLADVIQASRALERSEAELKAWRGRARLHVLGWGLFILIVGGAIYELIAW